eukprot:TRINITY_DN32483_c0_g1_i1.p1 TRINITY_DN32483_c0_g1~~TRINITY_DN32483_c0_g1_i1.p1  ORF type:complete len:153 (+),score=36.37 TRINITY_DN32483_c0_g1_i1:50-460(+)
MPSVPPSAVTRQPRQRRGLPWYYVLPFFSKPPAETVFAVSRRRPSRSDNFPRRWKWPLDDDAAEELLHARGAQKTNSVCADCPICLGTQDSGQEETVVFPCGHEFHRDCGLRWLCENVKCPMCRAHCTAVTDGTEQ